MSTYGINFCNDVVPFSEFNFLPDDEIFSAEGYEGTEIAVYEEFLYIATDDESWVVVLFAPVEGQVSGYFFEKGSGVQGAMFGATLSRGVARGESGAASEYEGEAVGAGGVAEGDKVYYVKFGENFPPFCVNNTIVTRFDGNALSYFDVLDPVFDGPALEDRIFLVVRIPVEGRRVWKVTWDESGVGLWRIILIEETHVGGKKGVAGFIARDDGGPVAVERVGVFGAEYP